MFRTRDPTVGIISDRGLWLLDWETDIQKIEIPTGQSDRDLVTSEYEQFIAYAYLLILFSSLESSLRVIVKGVYPTKFVK